MEKLKIKIGVEPIFFNHPPNLRISVNNTTLVDGPLREPTIIEREVDFTEDQIHTLDFTLHDKSKYDTEVDSDGNIVKDTLVKISELEIDDIDITGMLPVDQEKFYYKHDSGTVEPFYDTMGVNGTATVEFTSPFYQWLLETL
jgi:hypothetical protein